MKTLFYIVIICFSFVLQASCQDNDNKAIVDSEETDESEKDLIAIDLLKDTNFQTGFIHRGNTTDNVKNNIIATNSQVRPEWQLAQWFSNYVLTENDLKITSEDSYSLGNDANKISVVQDENGQSVLSFFSSSKMDYGENTVRLAGDPWPHFLFSQDIDNCPPLNELESIFFRINARVKSWKINYPELYNEKIHAARFRLNFIVKNINKNSEAFNDYYWFVMTFFDNRHLFMPETGKLDEGTDNKKGSGKYIYGSDAKQYLNKSLHELDWVSIDLDILPLIKLGLQQAQKGEYLPESDKLEDYAIRYFNFGYELTANIDIESQIKKLSVTAYIEEQ